MKHLLEQKKKTGTFNLKKYGKKDIQQGPLETTCKTCSV